MLQTFGQQLIKIHRISILIYLSLVSSHTLAANGINAIGFGAESVGMGSADLAVVKDSAALNINPAGLSQIKHKRFDIYTAAAHAIEIRHQDALGNNVINDNDWAAISSASYAHPMENFTLGIGVFAQGGVGVSYKELTTLFATTDELSSQLRIARITPGLSWQVNDSLSIGSSVLITYADMAQKLFPETSFLHPVDPMQSFFGQHVKGVDTFSAGMKLGALFTYSPDIKIGLAYTGKTELTMDGGKAHINMNAIGLGIVTYNDVEVGGIDQPEEIGLGIAWKMNETWLFSGELNWINWSEALDQSFITIRNPDNPSAIPEISQTGALNWKDQTVLALGLKHRTTKAGVIRAGLNIANNPVPNASLNPLLAPIARYHLTLGYGNVINKKWRYDVAIEYQIKESETYTNPQLPFGENSFTSSETAALHLVFSRRW